MLSTRCFLTIVCQNNVEEHCHWLFIFKFNNYRNRANNFIKWQFYQPWMDYKFFVFLQYAHSASNIISLAEHLGTRISDHVPETPNKLSEDMIKCMSAIYCKLSDPPLTHNSLSSPNSSSSSMSEFSPREQCDVWGPGFRNNSSLDIRLDNPFLVEGLKEFSGPYSTMAEVPWIYRDSKKLGDVENLLQNFRWADLPSDYYQKTC